MQHVFNKKLSRLGKGGSAFLLAKCLRTIALTPGIRILYLFQFVKNFSDVIPGGTGKNTRNSTNDVGAMNALGKTMRS
jgi:hypothetical protein